MHGAGVRYGPCRHLSQASCGPDGCLLQCAESSLGYDLFCIQDGQFLDLELDLDLERPPWLGWPGISQYHITKTLGTW